MLTALWSSSLSPAPSFSFRGDCGLSQFQADYGVPDLLCGTLGLQGISCLQVSSMCLAQLCPPLPQKLNDFPTWAHSWLHSHHRFHPPKVHSHTGRTRRHPHHQLHPRVYALFSSPGLMVMPVIMRWPVPFHPAALSVDCPTSSWDSVTSAPPIWYHQFPCDPSKVQSDPNSLTSTKPFKLFFPDLSPAFLLPQNSYVRELEVTSEPWQYPGSWLWAWIPMSPHW